MIYAIIGAIGIILLWRGVWHTADYFMMLRNSAISSEIKAEEKIAEKTEAEEKSETKRLEEIEKKFDEVTSHLDEHLENIERRLKDK